MAHHQAMTMRFMELDAPGNSLEKPCQVCISHKPNADGYLYKTWSVGGKKIKEAFHRFVYRAHNALDEWPKGCEAHHICSQRLCCEPSHIHLINTSAHKSLTNAERYSERNESARLHWMVFAPTGTELAKVFDVTISTACKWIREWKAEDEADRLAFGSA